jgi:membrane-associated phospholipid phosphatase
MYLGMHYPSDVIVGALIGIGASFLTFQTQKWITGTP